jgi:peptide/nickel transport system permease protein
MLYEGRVYLREAWWITTFPGLAIMITVMAVNRLGDGLRDALDPRLKV